MTRNAAPPAKPGVDQDLLISLPDGRVLDLSERLAELPRIPDIVMDFLALARRDNLTAREFEATLARDAGLERWLLRQANSSHSGQVRRIETLAEAMVIIGFERLKRMVYAVSSRTLLDRRLRCYDHADQGFWLHAMATGVVARALLDEATGVAARQEGHPGRLCDLNREEAFIAGLLHDVGKLVLDEALPRRGGRRKVSRAEERACCGFDHAWLSARIAASWRFPAGVIKAIAEHHADDREERIDGAALVACADTVCRTWGVGIATYPRTQVAVDPTPWQNLLAALGIDRAAWDSRLDELRPAIDGLAEMLRLCRTNLVAELSDADAAAPDSPATTANRRCSPSADEDRRSERRRGRRRQDRNPGPASRRRGRARRGRR